MSDTRIISHIYSSRKIILELLDTSNYNIDSYVNFSRNEIDTMFSVSQLDMLLHHRDDKRKVYVKYYIDLTKKQKQIQKKSLDEIIEDLFVIEEILTKDDTLIIIMDTEPNATTLKHLIFLYDKFGYFIIVQNIKALQFNLLKHEKVPPMELLSEEECKEFCHQYHIKDVSQLPEISRFDPQAKALCMRPNQIGRIERKSPTALITYFYRVCVNE